MKKIYSHPVSLKKTVFHYCPGCGHSIVHRIIAELIDEMNLRDVALGIPPPGCAVFTYNYFDIDMAESAHGRGAAVATGLKRASPGTFVFTYQGDGDLAAIGTAEIVHVCARGENITTIFVNNAIYGMTGGQMAPTTLLGMYSTSTTAGREKSLAGYPVRVCEMLSTMDGTAYIARVAVNSPAAVRKAKQAIKLAFRTQLANLGMSLVEVLSPCPTNWRVEPVKAMDWLNEHMLPQYPLGEYKVIEAVAALKKEVGNA